MDEAFVRGFIERWVDAWNAHDADALLELCTDDIVWEDPAVSGVLHGREGASGYLDDIWTTFPDLSFTLLGAPLLAAGEARAAQVWRLRGTMLGPDASGFAPTGKPVDQIGVDLYEFRDGRLAHYRALYDLMEAGRQMGLVPAAGGKAARTGAFLQRTSMRLRRRSHSVTAATTKHTNQSV